MRRLGGSTPTVRPVGGSDVVYIELTRPDWAMPMTTPSVTWRLDGQLVADAANSLSFPLARRPLSPATHRLTAKVGGGSRGAGAETRTWTIDNTPPDGVVHAVAADRLGRGPKGPSTSSIAISSR